MTPRKYIIKPNSLTHVYFRCHNKSFFLAPAAIKRTLLILLASYKHRYRVRIHEFCIMDNHCHLFVTAPDAYLLGCFMRTVGSQLATAINRYFDRDSQALRERYHSPIVIGQKHIVRVVKYIYMNRYRVNKLRPDLDFYCSAYWRIKKPHKFKIFAESKQAKINNLLAKLLDDYKCHDVPNTFGTKDITQQVVNEAISKINEVEADGVFDRGHTIADDLTLLFRTQQITSFRRERGPPNFE